MQEKKEEIEHIKSIATTRNSKTYSKLCGCGKIYITIAMKSDFPDKIDYVLLEGPKKDNECGDSFFNSMADMITFSVRRIRNIHEAEAIVKNLKGHICNRKIANRDRTQSCSDAVGQVLESILLKEPTMLPLGDTGHATSSGPSPSL